MKNHRVWIKVGTTLAVYVVMTGKLAISVWQDDVSSTLDFAQRFVVVSVDGGRDVSRHVIDVQSNSIDHTALELRRQAVRVLICGAASRRMARAMEQHDIQVVPFVAGKVDDVIQAYLQGELSDPRFLQPGCASGARQRWRNRGCCRNRPGRARTGEYSPGEEV